MFYIIVKGNSKVHFCKVVKETNFVNQNRGVISTLLIISFVYSFFVYSQSSRTEQVLTSESLRGQKLWQNNNCSACHQLYGLGGYLGPDLTNVYSNPKKGEVIIKAFLNSGVKTMPKFNFSEKEKNDLVAFLKQVDKTGIYPNLNAKTNANGWVEIETRNE